MIQHRLGPPYVRRDRVQPGADGTAARGRAATTGLTSTRTHLTVGSTPRTASRTLGRARGDATSQIDELPDPSFCDVPDRAPPDLPVHPAVKGLLEPPCEHLHGLAVDLVVVLSARR